MGILTLLVMNSCQVSSYVLMLARARYHNHQHIRLTEGLLKYGIVVCKGNKEMLIRLGMQGEHTVEMSFDPWPAEKLVALCGRYTGLLYVRSKQGILYVQAQLIAKDRVIMSGLCVLELKDAKNTRSDLSISLWKTMAQ
jgi:hypothetical protein